MYAFFCILHTKNNKTIRKARFLVLKKKKKFKLFDMNRDGKGVRKDEDTRPTFLNFFKFLFYLILLAIKLSRRRIQVHYR